MERKSTPRCGENAGLQSQTRGFSLLELLVVIGIILVVAAFAAPSWLSAIHQYQRESTARSIANIILRARFEAVKGNKRVATAFAPAAGVNGDLYGVDLNGNGTLEPNEPITMVLNGVSFWNSNAPAAPPTTNLPADYSTFTVPTAPAPQPPASQSPTPLTSYSIVFSPQGTVVVYQSPNWVLAPQVQGFAVTNGATIGAANSDSYLIEITPAGRVRLFHWQAGVGWVAR